MRVPAARTRDAYGLIRFTASKSPSDAASLSSAGAGSMFRRPATPPPYTPCVEPLLSGLLKKINGAPSLNGFDPTLRIATGCFATKQSS